MVAAARPHGIQLPAVVVAVAVAEAVNVTVEANELEGAAMGVTGPHETSKIASRISNTWNLFKSQNLREFPKTGESGLRAARRGLLAL